MKLLNDLISKNLANPPRWLKDNLQFAVAMGSRAYGCENTDSDTDIYGFCIPPKHIIFPHEAGMIQGFDKNIDQFNNWQQHHIYYQDKEYGFDVYSIIRYFRLVADNNPNMVDSLFVPGHCVLFETELARKVRENRNLFLSKKAYHTFHGYAHQQLHKMANKEKAGEKRKGYIEKYGYDVKFAYHLVRLTEECKQILEEGTLDLQRKRELYKSIRRGDWTETQVREWYSEQEKYLEALYHKSELRNSPDEKALKELLIECLERHYGSLSKSLHQPDKYENIVREIQKLIGNV